MGENKNIEELDAFARKYVKEIPKEKISLDFTASVMNKILLQSQQKVFTTKALISKKGWFVIAIVVLAIVLIPFKNLEQSLLNFPEFNFSFLEKFQFLNLLESVNISNTVLYAIFFFGLMIIAQVFVLKNYFNKRFS
ncbi:hypothetical protein [uncultured Polaribacter sp.]|uniref:hypothetical protein n=1 Tax=uncultured Polaribacter sp. TaxID=174711 RepID=UPI00259B4EB9|nr:hypothetical protein [uncultured Polaribacter sp.]